MHPDDRTASIRHKAHDDLEFLASSWNRFDVLAAVSEEPRTRHELKELTEVSRVTLSRILSDLEERNWIERAGDRYEATNRGTFIADELTRTLNNLVTADRLDDAVEWLPFDEFDFEFHRLEHATLITPNRADFTAPTAKLVELVDRSNRIRAIPTGITPAFLSAVRDATTRDDLEAEVVLPPAVFDIVMEDEELRRLFGDIIDSGNARIYRYHGDKECLMTGIFDEQVMVCGDHGEDGIPPGTLDTTDEEIRSWVESYFEERLADAEPLSTTVFAG